MRRNGERDDPAFLKRELERVTAHLEADGACVRSLGRETDRPARPAAATTLQDVDASTAVASALANGVAVAIDDACRAAGLVDTAIEALPFRARLYVPMRVHGLLPDAMLVIARHEAQPWTGAQIASAHEAATRCARRLRERSTPSPADAAPMPDDPTPDDPTPDDPTPDDSARLRVLLVEDEPYIVQWLQRQLGAAGHDVVTCRDVHSAVTRLRADPQWPTAVVIDLRLPDGSGIEVFEAAVDTPAAKARWVLMTGAVPGREARPLVEAGGRIVTKPFTADELLVALGVASA